MIGGLGCSLGLFCFLLLYLTALVNPLDTLLLSLFGICDNTLSRVFSVHLLGGNRFVSFFSAAFQRWCFDQKLFGFSLGSISGFTA
jgi:hypothetical protein